MRDSSSHPPLALVASDQDWSVRSLASVLDPNGYVVIRAETGFQVLEQTRAVRPDLLVLDAALPDIGGVDLCRMLRTDGGIGNTTPILVTSTDPVTRTLRLECLRAGAWECVGFPLDAEELLLKLQVYLASKSDADALREASLLDHDTGFYSARGMLRRVREMASDAGRHARPLACVALAPELEYDQEADRGTLHGSSEALQKVTRVLGSCGRTSDSIGRLGEYDFVILAPNTDEPGALRLAERLSRMAEAAPPSEAADPLRLRAGYYAVPNFQAADIEPIDLLVRATLALRRSQAEREGDRIRFFDPSRG